MLIIVALSEFHSCPVDQHGSVHEHLVDGRYLLTRQCFSFLLSYAADNLTDDWSRYWPGEVKAFAGLIRIDGAAYRYHHRRLQLNHDLSLLTR